MVSLLPTTNRAYEPVGTYPQRVDSLRLHTKSRASYQPWQLSDGREVIVREDLPKRIQRLRLDLEDALELLHALSLRLVELETALIALEKATTAKAPKLKYLS